MTVRLADWSLCVVVVEWQGELQLRQHMPKSVWSDWQCCCFALNEPMTGKEGDCTRSLTHDIEYHRVETHRSTQQMKHGFL